MQTRQRIDIKVNAALFIFYCVVSAANLLFEPEDAREVPWDKMYELFPMLSIVLAFLLAGGLILVGARLMQVVWNRFISDITSVREITFQEALTVSLVLSLFTT